MSTWVNNGRFTPRPYQIEDTDALIACPRYGLFSDVGTGKSKIFVDAAQRAHYERGEIDTVVIGVPGQALPVWADEEVGEIATHAWKGSKHRIIPFTAAGKGKLPSGRNPDGGIDFVVTNYEYVRHGQKGAKKRFKPGPHMARLLEWIAGRKVWAAYDEAWALKSHTAKQTKFAFELGRRVPRVTLLNGSPIASSPLDLFAQMAILDPAILKCPDFLTFRARYAIVVNNEYGPQIVGWQNLEELQRLIAPFVVRREMDQCLNLAAVESHIVKVPLTDRTWDTYTQMRTDLVAMLDHNTVAIARQAVVKVLRLAQILSGFVGGQEKLDDQLAFDYAAADSSIQPFDFTDTKAIGSEKCDAAIEFLHNWIRHTPAPRKAVLWTRFRDEQSLDFEKIKAAFPSFKVAVIRGQQKAAERKAALNLVWPGRDPADAIVLAHPGAGGAGLNFGACTLIGFLSHDFNLRVRLQALGRVIPRATRPVQLVDFIATGPRGQKTLDHHVVERLREKESLATWTIAAWRKAIVEE